MLEFDRKLSRQLKSFYWISNLIYIKLFVLIDSHKNVLNGLPVLQLHLKQTNKSIQTAKSTTKLHHIQ